MDALFFPLKISTPIIIFVFAFSMFFRDGVGEGQMKYVAEHEVEEIKKKLHEIYQKSDGYLNEDKQVQFSFIVVTKRINTRIFFGRQNPEPGTCVDDIITLPERYRIKFLSCNSVSLTLICFSKFFIQIRLFRGATKCSRRNSIANRVQCNQRYNGLATGSFTNFGVPVLFLLCK